MAWPCLTGPLSLTGCAQVWAGAESLLSLCGCWQQPATLLPGHGPLPGTACFTEQQDSPVQRDHGGDVVTRPYSKGQKPVSDPTALVRGMFGVGVPGGGTCAHLLVPTHCSETLLCLHARRGARCVALTEACAVASPLGGCIKDGQACPGGPLSLGLPARQCVGPRHSCVSACVTGSFFWFQEDLDIFLFLSVSGNLARPYFPSLRSNTKNSSCLS